MTIIDRFADLIYRRLGTDEWGDGSSKPPGSGWGIDYGEESDGRSMYVARWLNDGFELWLGFPHEWLTHMRRQDARRLAWHIIACDVALWFGLRRTLWYWALRRRLQRQGLVRWNRS